MYTRKPDSFVIPFLLGARGSQAISYQRTPGIFVADRFTIESDVPIQLSGLLIANNPVTDGDHRLLHVPGAPQLFEIENASLSGGAGVEATISSLADREGQASLIFLS